MNIIVDFNFIATILAIVIACIAIWQAMGAAKKTERAKGAHARDYEQVKKDTECNRAAVVALQSASQDGKVVLAKMEEQLAYLVKGVDELSVKFDRHVEKG
jgi:hypothetical protein